MIKGALITNKYLLGNTFSTLRERYGEAAKEIGIDLIQLDNCQAYELLSLKQAYDFILFYDKDIKLAKQLENNGYRVFNKSTAIATCDDKYLTYITLNGKVKQPYTINSPFLYFGSFVEDKDFILKIENEFKYPFIIKECNGSFGAQVYKIDNKKELVNRLDLLQDTPFLVQEFISTSFGKDIRALVVGGDVCCSMYRHNESGDFRANITNGAKAEAYTINNAQKEMAIKAVKEIGLDFAGVDILFGENDEPILCEVNSNAHIEAISKANNINVYKKILEHIVKTI